MSDDCERYLILNVIEAKLPRGPIGSYVQIENMGGGAFRIHGYADKYHPSMVNEDGKQWVALQAISGLRGEPVLVGWGRGASNHLQRLFVRERAEGDHHNRILQQLRDEVALAESRAQSAEQEARILRQSLETVGEQKSLAFAAGVEAMRIECCNRLDDRILPMMPGTAIRSIDEAKDAVLAATRRVGVAPCPECEGTGIDPECYEDDYNEGDWDVEE